MKQTLNIDSDLEEEEDGLHIDFGDVTQTLLVTCVASDNDRERVRCAVLEEAPRVASGGDSAHSCRTPVCLENHLLIEGH